MECPKDCPDGLKISENKKFCKIKLILIYKLGEEIIEVVSNSNSTKTNSTVKAAPVIKCTKAVKHRIKGKRY